MHMILKLTNVLNFFKKGVNLRYLLQKILNRDGLIFEYKNEKIFPYRIIQI